MNLFPPIYIGGCINRFICAYSISIGKWVCSLYGIYKYILYLYGIYIYVYIKRERDTVIYKIIYPGSSDSKKSACNAGDLNSIPGLGRSPGDRNGNLLQYS